MAITLNYTIREIPPDHRGGYELAREDRSVVAENYEAAKTKVVDDLPAGWQVIHFTVDRDEVGRPISPPA